MPWRGGCEYRERACAEITRRYSEAGIPYTLACAPPGEWCKGWAVWPVVASTDADVIVVADADCWCDQLADAIIHVADHGGWAIPHRQVHRLTAAGTIEWIDTGASELEEPPYDGVKGGGIVVITRDLYLRVPIDVRFKGWGCEDHSWGYALAWIHGQPWRGSAPLWHLYHPPQERPDRLSGNPESEWLRQRYRHATGSPERMAELVAEMGAECLSPR